MTPERWTQIEELFHRCLEAAPADPQAWLAAAAGEDGELVREVGALLAADAASASFLATPAGELLAVGRSAQVAALVGRQLGPYRLTGVLGSGGMSTVYRAERDDAAYARTVAVKVVHPSFASGELAAVLERERQILAGLEHPNIAHLYDGGTTTEGSPFLVIELVDGQPIDRYCAERALPLEARLRLFISVCRAVDHAHRNLVVHRDLKPSNILVRADGVPKLVDFGIAKLLHDFASEPGREPAQTGVRAMTPTHASPEQLRGQAVATTTDVYSLGVVLYQLLTGRLPYHFDATSPVDLDRAILEQEPTRPSQAVLHGLAAGLAEPPERLSRRCAGDLDVIVAKALRKEPERRYLSAAALADDLERHLERRPILARAESASYRLSRFLARHRLAATATTGAVLALLALTAHTWQQWQRANAERERSERAQHLLVSLLRSADPTVADSPTVSSRVMLDRAAAEARNELANEPLMLATILGSIAEIYQGLGYSQSAEELFRRVLAFWEEAGEAGASQRAETLAKLGEAQTTLGRLDEARSTLEAARDLTRRVHGATSPELATVLGLLAETYRSQARVPEALPLAEEAVRLHRAALAALPADRPPPHERALTRRRQLDLAISLNMLGVINEASGRHDEGLPLIRRAIEIWRPRVSPGDPDLTAALNNLGVGLAELGRLQEAEPVLREVWLGRRERLGGAHPKVAMSACNLATVLTDLDQLAEAKDVASECLAVRQRAFPADHPLIAVAECILGDVLRWRGDLDGAERLYLSARDRLARAGVKDHHHLSRPASGLGRIAILRGRWQEALPLLEETLAIRQRILPPDHWRIADAQSDLGFCLAKLGRNAEAKPLLRAALDRMALRFGPDNARVARVRERLQVLEAAADEPSGSGRREGPMVH